MPPLQCQNLIRDYQDGILTHLFVNFEIQLGVFPT